MSSSPTLPNKRSEQNGSCADLLLRPRLGVRRHHSAGFVLGFGNKEAIRDARVLRRKEQAATRKAFEEASEKDPGHTLTLVSLAIGGDVGFLLATESPAHSDRISGVMVDVYSESFGGAMADSLNISLKLMIA